MAPAPVAHGDAPPLVTGNPRRDQVVEALVGLGFTAKPAEAAVDGVLAGAPDADPSMLLRAALTQLGRT